MDYNTHKPSDTKYEYMGSKKIVRSSSATFRCIWAKVLFPCVN
jgi:hypothetical protein